jgi:DNA-binding response OmpR family regulator
MERYTMRAVRILCFDPDRDYLVNLKQRALHSGAQVDGFDSLEPLLNDEALTLEYDLVLLNADMLKKTGPAILDEIRERLGELPIAIGYDDDDQTSDRTVSQAGLLVPRSKGYDETVRLLITEAMAHAPDLGTAGGFY